ncbi:hypothetical protein [Streptomyces sp. NPDC017890]|uniref:hypothetical protein n=1 Tax=Streptomyces sp. NPDC017890 TaxID=3365015 RepID=UPI00378AC086
MNIWQPDPGEKLVARAPVAFATGAAPRVKGMRWFRDSERHDIQGELSGWPDGPTFTTRSVGNSRVQNSMRTAAKIAGVAVMALLSSAGGNISGGSVVASEDGTDTPDVPADEVEDFPVMWADPMTIARTLPWQLDPGRMTEKYNATHLIVTDRRMVVVLLPVCGDDLQSIEDDEIWQCRLADVEDAAPRNFKKGEDFVITFVDGSWCRLASNGRRQLLRYLAPPRELIHLDTLPPQQRQAITDFAAEKNIPDSVSANITRNPTGRIRVEFLPLSRLTAAFGATEVRVTLDSDGNRVDIDDYLPGDL